MMRYVRIYGHLAAINFAQLVAYRSNFINSIVSSLAWGFFSLYTIILLTSTTAEAYGWKRDEILLFNGIYGIVVGIFHMFFSINMRRLSRIIRWGELDLILTKPLDSQFAVSFWLIDYTMILRIIMAGGYTAWLLTRLGVEITIPMLLLTIAMSVVAIILLYSLWFIVLTTLIWFTNLVNLVELMFSFESLARFPQEVTGKLTNALFFLVLPLTLVINTPTRILMQRI